MGNISIQMSVSEVGWFGCCEGLHVGISCIGLVQEDN